MKEIILGLLFAATLMTACNNNQSTASKPASHNMQDMLLADSTTMSKSVTPETKKAVSLREIVSSYLVLKNALTEDNSNAAAKAGGEVLSAFENFNKSALTEFQKQTYEDVKAVAIEHAEHIGSNGGNIAHQREHFVLLSKDIYDLVKEFGGGQVLYWNFDSIYNKGKGAYWLSETKEIKNPYLGKAMLSIGSIKEEIK